jgi:hypothetical protein
MPIPSRASGRSSQSRSLSPVIGMCALAAPCPQIARLPERADLAVLGVVAADATCGDA